MPTGYSLTYEEVYSYFKKYECTLLEKEYFNNSIKMKFLCKCGEIGYKDFEHFKRSPRCSECNHRKRQTYDDVFKYFEKQGCKLLETKYINAITKMKYICKCGNIAYINWIDFRLGSRCNKCRYERMANKNRHSYEYIYNYFKERNCELLEDKYVNADQKLKYRCECENIAYITFGHFSQGERCSKCGGREKLTYVFVYNKFKESGCELLEKDYIDAHTLMKFKCSCGNIAYIRWMNFQQGQRCFECGIEKRVEKQKHPFEYIYQYFLDNNCKLLETNYSNCNTKMKYQCECGNISETTWNAFSHGHRCVLCSASLGERKIANYLIKNNITFEKEYKFKDCKNINSLPFDFAIFNNYNLCCLIEYDGKQHYEPNDYFGGKESLLKTKMRDSIKTNYCLQNSIPLLRIPYWDFENVERILDDYLFQNNQLQYPQEVQPTTNTNQQQKVVAS